MLVCTPSHIGKLQVDNMDVSPDILAARAKLRERLGATGQQMGGKGTARRKAKKVHKSTVTDDKKLQQTLKRVNLNTVPAIEDVQIVKTDGTVLHFASPKVQIAPSANTFVVSGNCETKDASSLISSYAGIPGLDGPIDPNVLKQLQGLCSNMNVGNDSSGGAAQTASENKKDGSDDEVPDLVTNFEDVSKEQ